MKLDVNVAVQLVILALGLYVALGSLRSVRGSGLVRGLVVATLFVGVFLWWISWVFAFEELEHIIRGLSGYAVIVLAIVLQPELRRGIAQFGVTRLVGQFLNQNRTETVTEVVLAVRTMAKRRQGALVTFERETPLDDYIENGVAIDALVNRLLIDSIFHPGCALHDGAIVISKGRVAAALCLFPLTENVEIAKSTGTRHRAALGLTEETDAVAVAVSEETGDISICQEGKLVRKIPPKELESLLREALASEKQREESAGNADPTLLERVRHTLVNFFHKNLLRKIAALVFAGMIFVTAHNQITAEAPLSLRVRSSVDTSEAALSGTLLIQLPGPDYRLVTPSDSAQLEFLARGTRGALEGVGSLSGVLSVKTETPASGLEFPLEQVAWTRSNGTSPKSINIEFATQGVRLFVERVARRPMRLTPEQLDIRLSGFDSRFFARAADASFDPAQVIITGPRDMIEEFGSASLPFTLEPLELGPEDTRNLSTRLELSRLLREAGFRFEHGSSIEVQLPIAPSLRDLSSIEREIAVVDLTPGPASKGQPAWTLPAHAQVARFRIRTVGMLPTDDPNAPERQAIAAAVRRFVEQNLVVFVDVSQLAEGESRSARVQHTLRRPWREVLGEDGIEINERAELTLELESEKEVLLVES